MSTSTGKEARVLMCTQCGAPFDAPPSGGMVNCEYCGATVHVRAQRTGPIRFQQPDLGLTPEQAEAARLESLRKQADHYDPNGPYAYAQPPSGLGYLSGTAHDDAFMTSALPAFDMAVKRCEASSGQLEAQRAVYWLACRLKGAWVRRGEAVRARAVLETARGLLPDPGYQMILTCLLADVHTHEGELDQAENLLAQCDPKPPQIDIDSTYRYSWGLLLLKRERWQDVLTVVGERYGQIPYEPSSIYILNSLRIVALEKLGRAEDAEREIRSLIDDRGEVDDLYRRFSGDAVFAPAKAALDRYVQKRKQDSWKEDAEQAIESLGGGDDQPMPDAPEHWNMLFFLIPLVIGGVMIGMAIDGEMKVKERADWQQIDGKVLETGVEAYSDDDSTSFYPQVVYEYTVDGVTYTNDEMGELSEGFSSTVQAKRVAESYEGREDLVVFYEPSDPSRSSLDPDVDPIYVIGWILGPIAFIVLFVLLGMHIAKTIRYHSALRKRVRG